MHNIQCMLCDRKLEISKILSKGSIRYECIHCHLVWTLSLDGMYIPKKSQFVELYWN